MEWRRADAAPVPARRCRSAEDVLAALLDSVEGGEQHLRPLSALRDSGRFARFTEVGLALRGACRDPAQRDYFLARLKPHLSLVIGVLPAGIQRHGLLPPQPAEPAPHALRLEQVSDAELRQWLVDDGSLIYGDSSALNWPIMSTRLRPTCGRAARCWTWAAAWEKWC